ncbi:TetR/AcrR family transcriptional regulator [Noviherbaspirillum sp. CPCC 100848]|uniref:TetR/AcrR family transcriptional regulator n=1 Tax=Noviherbaspirillum album TaxID=3080276 RepID=A0ABU6JJN3_9BURK|nr:TetR/AcrR family transcriptional regulator [Noviherbaspirillum sp. CPCC 100848]MEC4723490.1 TetR/AcrR family transcriptional regulator [Noviherbaspirillum sp. CPCC 100848]
MARGRAHNYDDQRDLILSRAAQLFAQRGYPGTSMNEVAEACGMSKPSLYHYFRDKYALLVTIAESHVEHLETVMLEVIDTQADARTRLEKLILRFVEEYAEAQHAHRVLTEDVRFLNDEDRERILDRERRVVSVFSDAIRAIRPDIDQARLGTPLAMLLFGMINWMFTWLKPDGKLNHAAMAPIVADLFFGGIPAVRMPAMQTPS